MQFRTHASYKNFTILLDMAAKVCGAVSSMESTACRVQQAVYRCCLQPGKKKLIISKINTKNHCYGITLIGLVMEVSLLLGLGTRLIRMEIVLANRVEY